MRFHSLFSLKNVCYHMVQVQEEEEEAASPAHDGNAQVKARPTLAEAQAKAAVVDGMYTEYQAALAEHKAVCKAAIAADTAVAKAAAIAANVVSEAAIATANADIATANADIVATNAARDAAITAATAAANAVFDVSSAKVFDDGFKDRISAARAEADKALAAAARREG